MLDQIGELVSLAFEVVRTGVSEAQLEENTFETFRYLAEDLLVGVFVIGFVVADLAAFGTHYALRD